MGLVQRSRNSAGQFSAKAALTARALRAAWALQSAQAAPLPGLAPVAFGAAVPKLLEFDAIASDFTADKIDDVNAIIRGVSVITSGLIARGHDLEVDDVTLAQMEKCASQKGKVPVKVDHKSGAAAICGFLTDFRQEHNKLKADWYLLESHPQKAQILEVARRMPGGVGLSASFVSPDSPERTKSGKAAARCQELISVDYVTLPAANPDGMFAAKVDSSKHAMNPEVLAAIQAAVAEAIAPIQAELAATQKQLEASLNPPSLEDLANMDEAQLAEIGLTPDQVTEALEAAAAGEGEGMGEGDGEGDAVASEAAPAAATAMGALTKRLTELEAKLGAKEKAEKDLSEDVLLSSIEQNIDLVVQENEHLRHALSAGSIAVASIGVAGDQSTKNLTEFEQLVETELAAMPEGKKSKAVAFSAAVAKNPDAHRTYLAGRGCVRQA